MPPFFAHSLSRVPALCLRFLLTEWMQLAIAGLHSLNSFLTVLHESSFWMQEIERGAAFKHGQNFLAVYAALAAEAHDKQLCYFKMKPKIHQPDSQHNS